VSLLVCGRYELTVVLPKEDREARTLVQVALLFALGSLIVLGGLTWSLAPAIAGWTSDGGRDAWQAIVLAPVLFLLMGTFQPLNHWLLRKQAFRAVSVNKVAQTTAIGLVAGAWAGGREHGTDVGLHRRLGGAPAGGLCAERLQGPAPAADRAGSGA